MKTNILLIALLLLFSIACNNSPKHASTNTHDETIKDSLTIKGTWERTSYYNYQDGIIADSFKTSEGNRHIKIFTKSKVMWCRNHEMDSTEWFGYGSYIITDTLLTETLEYGSIRMSQFIEKNPEFVFKYKLEKNRYSQIQIDEDGNPIFAENYSRIE